MNDLTIRNATLPDGGRADVAIAEGRIAEIAPAVSGSARRELDAAGLRIFPGFIDAHVHFNEPGREHWEGLATGSAALAAGGGTTFVDMPLNSNPPVLDRENFERKRAVAEEKSLLDFALWGGLCPGHVDRLDEMAEAGAAGFKAFLCPSGIEEFPATDEATLRQGLLRAKAHGLPVAVHAESPAVLARATAPRGTSLRDFFNSRPKNAEIESIRMACQLAGETGAALHVVHVSSAEGLAEIVKARAAGADVTAETCPHYLLFDADAASAIGARAKCAPPLRSRADVDALWDHLGEIDTIGSDHSPAPPSMKTGGDFFAIWGGIAGCQHAFPAFLGELQTRRPDLLPHAAGWLATNPARRLRLAGKGRLVPGGDADLTLVAFGPSPTIKAASLHYRHPMSLYEGFHPSCRVVHVFRRGEQLVADSSLQPVSSRGKFLRPLSPR